MQLVIRVESSQFADRLRSSAPNGVELVELSVAPDSRLAGGAVGAAAVVVVKWLTPIAQGVLAAWLYDVLKTARAEMRVNGTRVAHDSSAAQDTILEAIAVSVSQDAAHAPPAEQLEDEPAAADSSEVTPRPIQIPE